MSGGPEVRLSGVPTNAELAERAKTKTAREVVRGWLARHSQPLDMNYREWLDWAADNFIADPEVRAVMDRIAAERAAEALREAADEFAAGGSACGDYWAPGTEERREAEEISRQIGGEYRPHWPEAYSPYCDGCAAAEAADTDRDHVVSSLRARAEAMATGRQETT